MWGNEYILLFNILIYCAIYPKLGISLLTTTVLLSRKKNRSSHIDFKYTKHISKIKTSQWNQLNLRTLGHC